MGSSNLNLCSSYKQHMIPLALLALSAVQLCTSLPYYSRDGPLGMEELNMLHADAVKFGAASENVWFKAIDAATLDSLITEMNEMNRWFAKVVKYWDDFTSGGDGSNVLAENGPGIQKMQRVKQMQLLLMLSLLLMLREIRMPLLKMELVQREKPLLLQMKVQKRLQKKVKKRPLQKVIKLLIKRLLQMVKNLLKEMPPLEKKKLLKEKPLLQMIKQLLLILLLSLKGKLKKIHQQHEESE